MHLDREGVFRQNIELEGLGIFPEIWLFGLMKHSGEFVGVGVNAASEGA